MSRSRSGRITESMPAWLFTLIILSVVIVPRPASSSEEYLTKLKIASMPRNQAASFDMPDLDGRRVASQEFAGKLIVLNFWATWCGPCKDEMPAFERLRRTLDPDRVAVVTVTTDLQRDGIRHFLRTLNVQLPVLFDEDQEVSRAYMVRALPTTVIIGPTGQMIGRAVGPRQWDSAEAVALMRHLAEQHK